MGGVQVGRGGGGGAYKSKPVYGHAGCLSIILLDSTYKALIGSEEEMPIRMHTMTYTKHNPNEAGLHAQVVV